MSDWYLIYVNPRVFAIWILASYGVSGVSTPWWRNQMETFSTSLALCVGNSPVTSEFPSQRPVTRSFDVFFDLTLTNGWANHQDGGDLRCNCAHYDITLMPTICNRIKLYLVSWTRNHPSVVQLQAHHNCLLKGSICFVHRFIIVYGD